MSRNTSQKRGLALGAIVALLGSIFVSTPAQADSADGASIAIRPVVGTTLNGMVYNEFDLYANLLPGKTNANFSSALKWRINVTSGFTMDLVYSNSATASPALDESYAAASSSDYSVIAADATTATSASFAARAGNTGGVSYLTVKAFSTSTEATSWSSVTLTVTAWLDEVTIGNGVTSGTGVIDAGEWRTTQTVTLHNMSSLPVTNGWRAPAALDTWVTASATITGVNFENLGTGKFFLAVSSSQSVFGGAAQQSSSALAGSTLQVRAGVLTESWQISPISQSQSVSFQVRYDKRGTAGTYTAGFGKTATAYAATDPGVTTLLVTASAGVNLVESNSANALVVRPNQTNTFQVRASTGSTSVSTDVVVTISSTVLSTGSKAISVNGGAFVGNNVTITVTTGTNGVGTFTLATSGFADGDLVTVNASRGNVSANAVTIRTATPTFTVTGDSTHVVTTPGTAVNIGFTVKDQFGVLSSRTDHFLRVTRAGTAPFNYTATVSYTTVAAGRAVVAFTPQGATATGSDVLTLQSMRLEDGAYTNNGGSTTVTVVVTSSALAFSTGLAASRAASVSYFPSTISWSVITGNASAAGAGITVTGADLVFRLSSAVPATTSGSLSLNAGASGAYSFEVVSLKAGTKTMTLAIGANTTTSQLVVDDAASDFGRTITWDTTTIESGKTRVITGTLVDANGNPVDTTGVGYTAGDSGTASILVTYTGTAGIVVGSTPTETDADGKFRVSVLTSAADSGTLTLTAVYLPQGASTATADKITSVQAVTVAPAAAPEVNAVIGSYNGRWAVRVENAKGSVVSVKAGNRWVKFTSLNNNYLFSRKSVVGRTIAVSVWVDGELQNSQTITIK